MSIAKWKVVTDPQLKSQYGESLVAEYKGESVVMHCPDTATRGHRAWYVVTCVRTGKEIGRGPRKMDVYNKMRFWSPRGPGGSSDD